MEIGSIAEWATAIAETAAVIVALFLPYVERRKTERKEAHSYKLSLYATVERSLKNNNFDALRAFTEVSRFTDAKTRNKLDLEIAQQILDLADNTKLEPSLRSDEIRQLAEQIKPSEAD